MNEFVMSSEISIRLGAFFGIFFLVAVWELIAPRRQLTVSKIVRWYSNLGITFINSVLLRWFFPLLAVGLALLAQERSWGILNNFEFPSWLAVVLSVAALDCTIYLQHIMFHTVPALWRLHRMHHTDLDFDVTTGSRFHPIEILLSMLIKFAAVVVLGPPPVAVLIFEVLLNGTAMFNHGNIAIPVRIDRVLRWFVITPDMHRVHHSIRSRETHSNFGFNLPWWDRLFGTYCDQPRHGHEGMQIGIKIFREPKYLNLHWLLIQPFLKGRNKNVS
ncbi:MAG: sterol desaturase family protein [bacterium]|nr:sterol desaturase family protein [bacterium]